MVAPYAGTKRIEPTTIGHARGDPCVGVLGAPAATGAGSIRLRGSVSKSDLAGCAIAGLATNVIAAVQKIFRRDARAIRNTTANGNVALTSTLGD
jgi:hypothetical protein